MSVRFPFIDNTSSSTGFLMPRLDLPAATSTKAGGVRYTTVVWFRTQAFEYANNYDFILLGKGNGGTSGTGGRLAVSQSAGGILQLACTISHNTPASTTTTFTSVPLAYGKNYMAAVIVNGTTAYLVAAEVGGTTPAYSTVSATNLVAANMTTVQAWATVGAGTAGTVKAFYGPMEEFCMWTGTFPETTPDTVPDLTLLQNMANGVTALSAVVGLMTTGVEMFRYRLSNAADLADAKAVPAGNLTTVNIDANVGKPLWSAGPIRPVSLMPKVQSDQISQCVFGTVATMGSAFATIRTPSGTYTGITPTAIEARLLNEARGVVRDWTVVDPAPSGGTFVAGNLTNIPMTAGFLSLEIRAMNGLSVVGGPVTAWGHRGAGFSANSSAQSQLMQLFETPTASVAMPNGIRAIVMRESGTLGEYVIGASNLITDGATLGIRQAMIEINAKYPGIPIQIATVGQSGNPITEFYDTGLFASRWAGMKANMGFASGEPVPPFYMIFMGHSDTPTAGYATRVQDLTNFSATNFGVPIRYVHIPVPRYRGAGTTASSTGLGVAQSRNGAREICTAQPATHWWAGSWSNVATDGETPGTGLQPHPEASDRGMGRSGGHIGYALMSVARAIPDVPVGPTALNIVGSTAVIRFGPVNP